MVVGSPDFVPFFSISPSVIYVCILPASSILCSSQAYLFSFCTHVPPCIFGSHYFHPFLIVILKNTFHNFQYQCFQAATLQAYFEHIFLLLGDFEGYFEASGQYVKSIICELFGHTWALPSTEIEVTPKLTCLQYSKTWFKRPPHGASKGGR